MFPISCHDGTLNCLVLEDLELLWSLFFWKTQAAFNEMNIGVLKNIYFE